MKEYDDECLRLTVFNGATDRSIWLKSRHRLHSSVYDDNLHFLRS